jgi:gluconate 2-dehydrogenase gamma chain
MADQTSRREFVAQTASLLSGAWLAAHWPDIEALGISARAAQAEAAPFQVLTPAESRTMAAFASQIIPTDSTPGATEAGAVYFIDRALGGFAAGMLPVIRPALKELDTAAAKENRAARSFADLKAAQQIKLMRERERQPFFDLARTLTIMGVFSDPVYGGGRNNVGDQLLDMQHQPAWQPPFGYYDAQEASATKAREE